MCYLSECPPTIKKFVIRRCRQAAIAATRGCAGKQDRARDLRRKIPTFAKWGSVAVIAKSVFSTFTDKTKKMDALRVRRSALARIASIITSPF
jgi:hypothetical protein